MGWHNFDSSSAALILRELTRSPLNWLYRLGPKRSLRTTTPLEFFAGRLRGRGLSADTWGRWLNLGTHLGRARLRADDCGLILLSPFHGPFGIRLFFLPPLHALLPGRGSGGRICLTDHIGPRRRSSAGRFHC